MPIGQGWGRCQVRLTVLTLLRRQKRRGRRQEKRYLPHRITQEKHQLSRVMLTPGVGASSAGSWGRPAALGAELGSGLGVRRKPRALPPGVPNSQPRRSERVLPPLAGGQRQGPRDKAPTCLHLPRSRCGRCFHPRGFPLLLPLSSPPRDSLWAASFPGGVGGRCRYPDNFGGSGRRAGEAGRDRAEAVPGARRPPAGTQQPWEPGQRWRQHCALSCSECVSVRVWIPSRPHFNSHIALQSIM